MSETFSVGEIAILHIPSCDVGNRPQTVPNGAEVEICGPAQPYSQFNTSVFRLNEFEYLGLGYPILSHGEEKWAALRWLRKRKPPDEQKKRETDKPELGSWDVCPFGTDQKPWRPRRVTA